jgi:hypothetical protein
MRRAVVTAALSGVALFGCRTTHQEGRLYSMEDGRVSSVIIRDARSTNGTVTCSLPTGEPCHGDFTAVTDDTASIGDSPAIAIGMSAERAVVLLVCGAGRALKCTLARRPGDGFSYGGCKDQQQGVEYAMMF